LIFIIVDSRYMLWGILMKDNEIMDGWEILDLALFMRKENTLIISDLQLGYEEMMQKKGVLMPRFNFREIHDRLERIFTGLSAGGIVKLDRIIVNGDFKHEFGKILEQEWGEVIDTITLLQKHCNELVLVKGNHDITLGPIAKWKEVSFMDFFLLDGGKTIVLHGDSTDYKELKKASNIVIGHEHPAITIREAVKAETFKCFLKGKWKGKTIVVLPSMNSVSIGSDVTKNEPLSPFLKAGVDEFEAWVVGDRPYYFGKVKGISE